MKRFLILTCLAGAAVPWLFFAIYIYQTEISTFRLLADIFPNALASGFSSDLLIASLAFLVYSFFDFSKNNKKFWPLLLISNLLVGLSLALPLYFLIKLSQKNKSI